MWHPRDVTLQRFADGDLRDSARSGVARHLVCCPECRRRVGGIRAIDRAAGELGPLRPRAGLKDEIMEQVGAGQRGIVPLYDPITAGLPAGRGWRVGAGVVVALLLGWGLFASRPLASAAGSLVITPEQPQAGDTLRVEYFSVGEFAGEDRLNLRGRYRRIGDPDWVAAPSIMVTHLERERTGLYRGTVVMPPDVAHAVFAVEDADGERVDHGRVRPWEVLLHDGARPTLAALQQRLFALNDLRSWSGLRETAERLTALYPDEPGSWWSHEYVYSVSSQLGDSLRPAYRAMFERFDATLRERASGGEIALMYWLAYGSQADSADLAYWHDRMLTESTHWLALVWQMLDVLIRNADRPAARLTALQALWRPEQPTSPDLVRQGIQAARDARDPEAVQWWIDRVQPAHHEQITWEVLDLDGPEFSGVRLAQLAEEMRYLNGRDDAVRPLELTVSEFAEVNSRLRRRLSVYLAREFISLGDVTQARDALHDAIQLGWDAETFGLAVPLLWAVGDTARALEVAALLASDPGASSTTDSLVATAASRVEPGRWEAAVRRAWLEMPTRVMATANPEGTLRPGVLLRDARGIERDLFEIVDGRLSVIALMDPEAHPAVEDAPVFGAIARQLRDVGIESYLVLPAEALETGPVGLEGLGEIPIYTDVHGDVHDALNTWGTPAYFVVGQGGRIWFSRTSVEDVAAQAWALLRYQGDRALVADAP